MGGWVELYPIFLDFGLFYNFAKPGESRAVYAGLILLITPFYCGMDMFPESTKGQGTNKQRDKTRKA